MSVAKALLDIKAVLLSPEKPFTWASGWLSPIYCDNRRILSYPDIRENVCRLMADIIRNKYPDADVIAGVATGAIAHGMLISYFLGKPFVYVRPKPKDHGTGSQIEGILEKGAKVVVVEDLISTGKSSLAAVDALNKASAEVLGMVAIFLSIGSGWLISQQYSSSLLKNSLEVEESEYEEYMTDTLNYELLAQDVTDNYKITITFEDVSILIILSFSTILLSTAFPLFYIMRLDPKEILLE